MKVMNKLYIYTLILLFTVFSVNETFAQVTAGSNKVPASFSVLQLDGTTGGLRLPQISNKSLININASSSAARKLLARGLTIYDTNTGWVEYWNGTDWAPVSQSLPVTNGIKEYTNYIGLGGNLAEDTPINLKTFNLNLKTNSATGKFIVNTNVLQIDNRNIRFQPSRFSVNTNLLSVTSDAITLNPYVGGTGIYTLKSLKTDETDTGNSIVVTNNNVQVNGDLSYRDNGDNPVTVGHAMVSMDNGDAYWAPLKPETSFKHGTFLSSVNIERTTTNDTYYTNMTTTQITDTPLKLTPGKWMIFASYATTSTGTAAQNVNYVWTYLYKQATSGGTKDLVTVMGKPTSSNDASRTTFPNLVFVVDVTEETNFTLECGTRNYSTSLSYAYDAPSFFAMSIIEAGK